MAGTAGAVHHHQEKKYAQKDYEQQQMYAAQQEQAAPPQEYAAAPAGDDLTAQLQQLSQLHNAGVLSDAEFAAAKQKLLSG
jgi:membrane protease subunit (stomatin/prohibitin family)